MSYLKHVLQPGETVRYRGSLHWVRYLNALPWAILGAAIILVSLRTDRFGAWWIAGAILLIAALLMILRAWFERWATEVLVTDRRVIYARHDPQNAPLIPWKAGYAGVTGKKGRC